MLLDNKQREESHNGRVAARKYRVFTRRNIDKIPQLKTLPAAERAAMSAVAAVFPFRVNKTTSSRS